MEARVQRYERKLALEHIKPNPRNARTHSAKQVSQIARSIREFGALVPVVVRTDGTLLAGHGRLEAAKKLGLKHIPAIIANGLTEAQQRAFALADNKIAENAGWD